MAIHDFNKSLELGKKGEQVIREFFESSLTVSRYEDVSENKEYQDKDIDGIVWMKSGIPLTVELKTDKYTSGNIFYETASCVEFHTQGCMDKTQAECLCYYFPNFQCMYCIRMDEYRKWFNANSSKFRYVQFANYTRNRQGTYHSGGRLIPITYLEEHFDARHWRKVPMPRVNVT